MGDTPSKYDEPLQPQPVPIWVVEPRFCVPYETNLLLREKIFSWSGDDYKIKDPRTDTLWFRVQGRAFSGISDKKIMNDYTGTPVLNIKHTLAFFEQNYKIFKGTDSAQQLCKVLAQITMAKAKMSTVVVNGQTGQQLLFVLKGNVLSREAVIYIGEPKQNGIPIAKIHRPYSGREWMSGAQDYILTVAPNVDVSMMVALCICLDECKKD